MFPINLDNNKYCSHEHCTLFIRSALKGRPYENTACVFLIWTILQTKMSTGQRGVFHPPIGWLPLYPTPMAMPPTPC